jgi:hypothetical protein
MRACFRCLKGSHDARLSLRRRFAIGSCRIMLLKPAVLTRSGNQLGWTAARHPIEYRPWIGYLSRQAATLRRNDDHEA